MSVSVSIDDMLAPSIRALRPAARKHFQQAVHRLEQNGLHGAGARRLRHAPHSESSAPLWSVRVGSRFRALVTETEDGLLITDLVPNKRLKKQSEQLSP